MNVEFTEIELQLHLDMYILLPAILYPHAILLMVGGNQSIMVLVLPKSG